jgi:hypothetical protein
LEAAQKAQEAAEALRVDEYIGRIEKEAPETFAGFLRYVERKRSEVRTKFQKIAPSICARILADLDTPEKRRELFTQWQALPRQEPDTQGEWQQLSILDTFLHGNRMATRATKRRQMRPPTRRAIERGSLISFKPHSGREGDKEELLSEWETHANRNVYSGAQPDSNAILADTSSTRPLVKRPPKSWKRC